MTTPLFRRVDCLSIPVPDVDAALAFYSANLGHELIWRSSKAAGLKLPGSNAELVFRIVNQVNICHGILREGIHGQSDSADRGQRARSA